MKKTGKNEKVKMKNEKLFIIHCSLFIAAALCGGCMSPSGETGRSIRNTQNIRDCEIHVNVYASLAGSNAVAAADGVMPEIKVLSVDGLIAADHNQIIWGGNYFLLPPSRCFVVWDKCQGENFSMSMAEFAWTSFQSVAKIFKRQSNGNARYKRIHPTQKPPDLYKFLLRHFANPGDRILDTHLGSGTIAEACHDLGFDLVGCEIDPDYYAAAKARLDDIRSHTPAPLPLR